MTTSLDQKDDTYEKVKDFLGFLKHDVDYSRDLHDVGITTKLSSSIEGLITDPFKSLIDMHNMSIANLKKLVSNLALRYLSSKKELITKAFQVDQNNKLIYYVVLKDDSVENRDVFFEFLSFYDELGIQNNLPVIIKFLPQRVMAQANLEKELTLN